MSTEPNAAPGMVVALSLLSALRHVMLRGSIGVSECRPLQEVIAESVSRSLGPLLLFPEGVPSNGLGVLKFQRTLHGVQAARRIFLVGIKCVFLFARFRAARCLPWRCSDAVVMRRHRYVDKSACGAFTVHSPAGHVVRLCATVNTPVAVLYMAPSMVPAHPLLAADNNSRKPLSLTGAGVPVPTETPAEKWERSIQNVLAERLLGASALEVGLAESVEFLKFFHKTHSTSTGYVS